MSVICEKHAQQEGIHAAQWYEMQQPELAKRFLVEWKRTEIRMMANPEAYRCFNKDYRSCHFETLSLQTHLQNHERRHSSPSGYALESQPRLLATQSVNFIQ